ncbi:MAG: hypothetical protein U9O53_06165, partial [archaeon]|nr:hypothetical protein [archaeon]
DVALPDNPWVAGHKYLSPETVEKIYRIYSEMGCKKPLFKKSSCAASYIEHMPDFNAHWSNSSKNGSPFCPQEQKTRCKDQSRQILPYDIIPMIPSLTREQKTFYRQKYRLPVM